jgi:hypothetical protein
MVKKSIARLKQNVEFAKSQRRMASDYVLIVLQWLRDRRATSLDPRRDRTGSGKGSVSEVTGL